MTAFNPDKTWRGVTDATSLPRQPNEKFISVDIVE
jgi:hypothetical protein